MSLSNELETRGSRHCTQLRIRCSKLCLVVLIVKMEKKVVNQKEYLKKYISGPDKKKKKKKLKVGLKTVKIIDDDIDLKNMKPIDDNDFDIFITSEDAPQIAGIVDERGPVDFDDKRKWRIIMDNTDGDLMITSNQLPQKQLGPAKNLTNDGDGELSPPRPSKNLKQKEKHGKRKNDTDNDSDLSPARKSKKKHTKSESSDDSESSSDSSEREYKEKKRKKDKKRKQEGNSDFSLPRKSKNYDSDPSPPRKSRVDDSHKEGRKYKPYKVKLHRDSDSDLSPLGRRNRGTDRNVSPPRTSKEYCKVPNDRRDRSKERDRYDERREKSWRHGNDDRRRDSKSVDVTDRSERKMKKTLDGKTAGLQDAKALKEETEAHKKREAEHFSKLSKEISGVGKAAVVRNSKTGRKRDLEAEAAEEREKQKRQNELNEKYAKWGTGLKQVEDREKKLKDDLYEISKPLARYADDDDLNARLQEREREGDPMLEYIKQKQIKEGKRKPDRPSYEGSFMPNRFGIKPGHRWDGVDRSNGYEKKWFDARNAKLALQEDAYKWSTADM